MALAQRHGFPTAPFDRPHELAEFLAAYSPPAACVRQGTGAQGAGAPGQAPVPGTHGHGLGHWPVAPLSTVGHLQDLLGLGSGDLRRFAHTRAKNPPPPTSGCATTATGGYSRRPSTPD